MLVANSLRKEQLTVTATSGAGVFVAPSLPTLCPLRCQKYKVSQCSHVPRNAVVEGFWGGPPQP